MKRDETKLNKIENQHMGTPIDIESLRNRLLNVLYVPATSAGLPRLSLFSFFSFFFAVAINSTNEANKAGCMGH